tara:strand:+ start:10422 stop:10649 length:228 start_codon:yes stop_codon:yes gene_type:complete
MADISMCNNILCPNSKYCYRVKAIPSHWQSYGSFQYTVGENGVMCDYYIPTDEQTIRQTSNTLEFEDLADELSRR